MKKWYAVRTAPNAEANVTKRLRASKVITLHLRYKGRSTRSGYVVWKELTYFPCYLFVFVDEARMPKVSKAGGKLVSIAGDPVPIPRPIIKVISTGADKTGLISMGTKSLMRARYAKMQRVEFTEASPFAGAIAKVIRDDNTDTVRLLMEILGTWREASVPLSHVRAA